MPKNLAIQSCHQRHEVRPWLPLPSNFSGLYDLGNKGTALKCQYYNPETTNARTEVFTQLRFDLRFFGVFRFFMPSEQSNSHLVRFLFAHPFLFAQLDRMNKYPAWSNQWSHQAPRTLGIVGIVYLQGWKIQRDITRFKLRVAQEQSHP